MTDSTGESRETVRRLEVKRLTKLLRELAAIGNLRHAASLSSRGLDGQARTIRSNKCDIKVIYQYHGM